MAQSITFTSAPFKQVTQFVPADTTTTKTILNADSLYDRRIYSISIFTDDTAAKDVKIYLSDGTTTWQLTTISIPLNSGNTNSVVPVDLFTHSQLAPFIKQRDAAGAPYLNIPKNWTVRLSYATAITAAKISNVVVDGESYA